MKWALLVIMLILAGNAFAIETEEACFLLLKIESWNRMGEELPVSYNDIKDLPPQQIDGSSASGGVYLFSLYGYGAPTTYPLSMTKNSTDTYMEKNIVFFYTPGKRLAECDFFRFTVSNDSAGKLNFNKPESFEYSALNTSYEDKNFFEMHQSYRIDDTSGINVMNRTSINLVPVDNAEALEQAESAGRMLSSGDTRTFFSRTYGNRFESDGLQWLILGGAVAFTVVLGIVFFRRKNISYSRILSNIERDIQKKDPAKAQKEYFKLVRLYKRIDSRSPRKKEVYEEIVRVNERLKSAFKSSG